MSDAHTGFVAAASLVIGIFIGAIGADHYNHGGAERLARDKAEMEMFIKLAPIWCGQDGCQ